jgi:NAD(P)-dependent dehydrogenase (short-subunit alcohol dehydrogenase family)
VPHKSNGHRGPRWVESGCGEGLRLLSRRLASVTFRLAPVSRSVTTASGMSALELHSSQAEWLEISYSSRRATTGNWLKVGMMEIADRNIVVTGGGNGIGEAMCRRFAAEGAGAVTVCDLDLAAARRVAEDIGGLALEIDVAAEEDIKEAAATVRAQFGPIDIWCSNAGIGGRGDLEAAAEVWQRSWQVNVMAHVYAARAAIPEMLERGEGYLLQTVSAGGLVTGPASPYYTTTKHAAIGLAEWLAMTFGPKGIRVSCICPQAVDTSMVRSVSDPATLAALADIGTLLTPDAVAESVVEGVSAETFLILPNPEVLEYFRRKASDYDRWLRGMQRMMSRSALFSGDP